MAHLWRETPLLYSKYASDRLDSDVYLKLENLQHSHSFKYRGISLYAQEALARYGPNAHLIVASGGNAAYATCLVALSLNMRCTAFVPEGARSMEPLLEATKAKVNIGGKNYPEALKRAQEAVAQDPVAVLVPAYDHPTLWKGHSSMIREVSVQLPPNTKPDAIVCAVGGGGLLCGVVTGCREVGWDDVPIVGMETHGSNCFYQSFVANTKDTIDSQAQGNEATIVSDDAHSVKVAHLSQLTSRAACLGASSPSAGALKQVLDREGPVLCICVSDEESMKAGVDFLSEHKMMVELACSTALVPAYDPRILKSTVLRQAQRKPVIVFIVCGGVNITLEEMVEYQDIVRRGTPYSDPLWVDGQVVL